MDITQHLKKENIDDKLLVYIEYENAYKLDYKYQWLILQCGVKTKVYYISDFISQIYSIDIQEISKTENKKLMNIEDYVTYLNVEKDIFRYNDCICIISKYKSMKTIKSNNDKTIKLWQ